MSRSPPRRGDTVEPPRLTEAERVALKAIVENEAALNQTLAVVLSQHTQTIERLQPLKEEFWRNVKARLGTDEDMLSADANTGVITIGREAIKKLSLHDRAAAFGLKWPIS